MNTTIQLHSNILAKVKFFSKQLQLKLHKSTCRKLALQGEETIALSIFKQTYSTDVPVCLNKNAKCHKTMKLLSSWGHSGKGFYYGLKMNMTADADRTKLPKS